MDIFDKLLHDFQSSSAWLEFSVLIGCLLLAYAAMRGLQAHMGPWDEARPSVWIGRHAMDGALFPLLALALVFTGQEILVRFSPVFWLRVAVSLLVSLSVIRFVARVLSRTFPDSTVVRLIERIVSWLAWGAAVLHSIGLLPQVLDELQALQLSIGKTPVSLLNLIEGTLSAGLMMVAVLWLSTLLEQKLINPWVSDLSMRKVAMNLMRSLLILVGLLVSLSMVGVDLTALSVMGGALGVGLGFGMQKIASNYVSGFLVLIERALRIGDNVRVDGFEGRITDIRTRYTVIRASNGRESIVPNESLITQRVENLTGFDSRFGLSTTIVVGMDSDVDQVRSILLAAASSQPRVLDTPAPSVNLVDFVEHGLQFSLGYYINDPHNGQANVRSDVNLAVLRGLREAGISLPTPRPMAPIAERVGSVSEKKG
ncbi:mechanosensitive ion channel family protein [Delftia sp. PS-11]|uniref:mechanosensitive ion channel family protein n=1 Tax=Delftia sp. PS-11 TaxID=2767222 RepID=UPI0024548CF0|nr:mechanosensitive ion channel domain-containing protein [Delftia sp. PS-11]KAJ8743574.1 mechanosensitive ion channel [Delftia sp. PS-11]